MRLENQFYETPRNFEQKVYVVGDLESLSASVLYTDHLPKMGPGGFGVLPKIDSGYGGESSIIKTPLMDSNITIEPVNLKKFTDYSKLLENKDQTIGITHHSTGLGKLKIFDKEEEKEYGIPVLDILNKPLSKWRIDKK